MDNLSLPFIPGSVAEQWMLGRDPDEINSALEEIIDQYRGCSSATRAKLPSRNVLSLLQQVLGKMSIQDDGLRLNCLRLLRLLAEDHFLMFLEVSFLLYSKIQSLLQDPNRVLRTAALSLAVTLSATIPLYDIADNVLSLVESRPSYREYTLKVACVSLLNLIKQCCKRAVATESHKRLLRAYVVRLASCAASEFSVNSPQHNHRGQREDDKAIAHAAMDVLALASLAVSELDNASVRDGDLATACVLATPLPAVRALKVCIDTLQMNHLELDNGVEREVCRRIRNLDFPSLAEETIYAAVKPLIFAIKHSSTGGRKGGDKMVPALDTLVIAKQRDDSGSRLVTGSPGVDTSDAEASPRLTPRKPVGSSPAAAARRGNPLRKSWSGVTAEPSPRNAEHTPDAPSSAKFSPPKLSSGQSHSFHGSPLSARKTLRSLSQKSGEGLYQPSWSASSASSNGSVAEQSAAYDNDRAAPRGGRRYYARDSESSQSNAAGEVASFHSSGHSEIDSVCTAPSYSSASASFHQVRMVGRSSDLELDQLGMSHVPSVSFDDVPAATPSRNYMEKSLRLIKSPHSRQRSEGSSVHASDSAYNETMNSTNTREPLRSHTAEYNHDSGQSSEWPGAEGALDLNSRPPPSTHSFDSASKARLKRSRLKSANANLRGSGESTASDAAVPTEMNADEPFRSPSKGSLHQRTPASMSDSGLGRHLDNPFTFDEKPVGGQGRQGGYFNSEGDLQAMGAFQSADPAKSPSPDSAAPTPLRKPGRRSKLSGTATAPPDSPAPLNLSEVTSLITKPDPTFDYIASEDLKPLTAPAAELSKAHKGLETQEWPEIFHTLNTFRRAALHHPAVLLNSANLHNTTVLMMKRVDELRSSLAKNAILTVEDMIKGLGRAMDMEVATFLPGILKRSIDSSSFLGESADNVLQAMIDHLTAARSLFGLLAHVAHRSPAARAKVAICLHALVHSRGGELVSCKDFEGLKMALPKLIQDSAPDARAYSRETIRLLFHRGLVGRSEMEAYISPDQLDRILGEIAPHMLSTTVSGRVGTAPTSADYGHRGVTSSPMRSAGRRPARNRVSSHDAADRTAVTTAESPAGDWTPYDYGCASSEGGATPARESGRDRLSRPSPARQQPFTPNKPNGPRGRGRTDSDIEEHSAARLRATAEQLSSQLDAHLGTSTATAPSPSHRRTISDQPRSANGFANKSTGSTGTASSMGGSGGSNAASAAVAAAAKRAMEQDPELSCLREVLSATAVPSWTERKTAIDRLTDLLIKHYDVLRDANKLSVCVDCLLSRLEDGSVKVHTHALGCLERINEEEPLVLQHNLLQIVAPAVLGSAGSSNKVINGRSVQLLRLLFDTLHPLQVAQFLCQIALHEKDKQRLTALRFLADVMPVFCADQEFITSISKKIIFPALLKLLFTSSTKADVRVCAVECVRALQASLARPEKVWLWTEDPAQREELRRITSTV